MSFYDFGGDDLSSPKNSGGGGPSGGNGGGGGGGGLGFGLGMSYQYGPGYNAGAPGYGMQRKRYAMPAGVGTDPRMASYFSGAPAQPTAPGAPGGMMGRSPFLRRFQQQQQPAQPAQPSYMDELSRDQARTQEMMGAAGQMAARNAGNMQRQADTRLDLNSDNLDPSQLAFQRMSAQRGVLGQQQQSMFDAIYGQQQTGQQFARDLASKNYGAGLQHNLSEQQFYNNRTLQREQQKKKGGVMGAIGSGLGMAAGAFFGGPGGAALGSKLGGGLFGGGGGGGETPNWGTNSGGQTGYLDYINGGGFDPSWSGYRG